MHYAGSMNSTIALCLALGQVLILPATAQELIVPRKAQEGKPEGGAEEGSEEESEAEPVDDPSRYTVQAGDSLGHIAQEKGLSLAEIMEANQIANPDSIYVGQELVIPTKLGFIGEATQNSGTASDTDESASENPTPTNWSPTQRLFLLQREAREIIYPNWHANLIAHNWHCLNTTTYPIRIQSMRGWNCVFPMAHLPCHLTCRPFPSPVATLSSASAASNAGCCKPTVCAILGIVAQAMVSGLLVQAPLPYRPR